MVVRKKDAEDYVNFVEYLVLELVRDSVLEKYWQRIDSFSSLPVFAQI